jgi:uncharacterized membrane protein HdeD (DUF308 family)
MTSDRITSTRRRRAFVALFFVVTGMFALGEPMIAGLAVALLVGWALVFAAVGHAVSAFGAGGPGPTIIRMLLGMAYLAAGIYFVTHPLIGLRALTVVLALVLLVEAVLEVAMYLYSPPERRSAWLLVGALVTALVAIMIWLGWPSSSVWAIGTLLGVKLIWSGMMRYMVRPTESSISGASVIAD